MAAVDFDGQAAFESWTSATDMNTEKINEFFPNLVGGCDALESFLQKLNG